MTSAFKILKSFDDFSYINLLGDEKYMLSLIKTNKDEGREEGRKEGREEGIKEGIKKGKSEGLKEGRENFQIETLIKLFYSASSFCTWLGSIAIPGPIVGAIAMLLT